MKKIAVLLILGALMPAAVLRAGRRDWKKEASNPEYLHRAVKQVTDVMVHDIFSPPVASRIYAYVTVAGYEALRFTDVHYISFAGQLNGLQAMPLPDKQHLPNYSIAAVNAVLLVGSTMVISEEKVDQYRAQMIKEWKAMGVPADVLNNSLGFGKMIADHILAWAAKDNYKESRSYPRYTIHDDSGSWKPTPPAYMKAVEPNWNALRPFLLDSAQQFKPLPAVSFSKDTASRFYKEAKHVHEVTSKLTDEQVAIANFWDCNPFKMNVSGHVMFATKKISPGGHWINITAVVCRQVGANALRCAEAYACVSVAVADAFISCWDEKYRSSVIRPETYINRYMDPSWMPLLQTPPFPEYTSGHSVVSAASAVILNKLFGDHFTFTDATENEFGLPARKFSSFMQAAEEAAISRIYGGIHYLPSINNGVAEGKAIGTFVAGRLKMRTANAM